MKNKQNINITISQNIIKKLNEFENKSEIINQILKEHFDDEAKNKNELSNMKTEIIELKNQMKRIDFFAKTSANTSRFILQSISKNDDEANKNYNEILEMIKNFKNSNS